MGRGRRLGIAATIAVAFVVVFLLTRGLPPPVPNPPGTFAFAALGDAPYYVWEDAQYPLVLRDIFWRPCSDEN